MNRKVVCSAVLIIGLTGLVRAQTPNVKFVQGDTIQVVKGNKDYYELDLKGEPFTLVFEGDELHVCAGLDEELFSYTQPGTDINADANSYFFIFKYLAGSRDSDFLSIEKDTGNALNETHGAQLADGSNYQYTVRTLMNDGDLAPISEFKRLFFSLWLDSDKDQLVDKEELMWVRANIKKK